MKQIDEVVSTLELSDVPLWAMEPLLDGLGRLKTILTFISFFGMEMATAELLSFNARARELQSALIAMEPSKAGSGYRAVYRVLEAVVVIGHLICLPAEGQHAFQTYKGWLAGPVTHEIAPPQQPKQITGPSNNTQLEDT